MKTLTFKNMPDEELISWYFERKKEWDFISEEYKKAKLKMIEIQKEETRISQRFMTVQHWVRSRGIILNDPT